jgi:hypothetical protein
LLKMRNPPSAMIRRKILWLKIDAKPFVERREVGASGRERSKAGIVQHEPASTSASPIGARQLSSPRSKRM